MTRKITAGLFTIAVFLNAALLFSVQPMFSKMALPLLGGTPAVWNTCMLFFQAALLGGYLYAHLTTRTLSVQRHVPIHVTLLALSGLALPIGIALVRIFAEDADRIFIGIDPRVKIQHPSYSLLRV